MCYSPAGHGLRKPHPLAPALGAADWSVPLTGFRRLLGGCAKRVTSPKVQNHGHFSFAEGLSLPGLYWSPPASLPTSHREAPSLGLGGLPSPCALCPWCSCVKSLTSHRKCREMGRPRGRGLLREHTKVPRRTWTRHLGWGGRWLGSFLRRLGLQDLVFLSVGLGGGLTERLLLSYLLPTLLSASTRHLYTEPMLEECQCLVSPILHLLRAPCPQPALGHPCLSPRGAPLLALQTQLSSSCFGKLGTQWVLHTASRPSPSTYHRAGPPCASLCSGL